MNDPGTHDPMAARGDAAPSPAQAKAQRALWGLPSWVQWRELIFDHPGVGQGYRLHVIVMGSGASIRPEMESRLAGLMIEVEEQS